MRWICRAGKWCGSTTRAPRSAHLPPSPADESWSGRPKADCFASPKPSALKPSSPQALSKFDRYRRPVDLDALDVLEVRLHFAQRQVRSQLALQRLELGFIG